MSLKESRFGPFYGCNRFPQCRATHGAHPDGRPLGIPANKETKQARIRAHDAFDRLWKGGRMTRAQAYGWMQRAMDLSKDEAHIGRFSIEQCEALGREVAAILENES
jgi:ssDNA-binding Zn-finger/Zn-ribbon topoisomerase 1